MLSDIIDAIEKSLRSLADLAPIKAVIAILIAFPGNNHYPVICAFMALIAIDLFTKWMALSYKHMIDGGSSVDSMSLVQCVTDMPHAFHDGYISSQAMKTRFVGKIILYMILIYTASQVDIVTGNNGAFVQGVCYYLAATEAISIVENLRDAGVQSLEPLLSFIRSKLGGIK